MNDVSSNAVLEPETATLPVPEPESRESSDNIIDAAEALKMIPVAFELLRSKMLRLAEIANEAAADHDEELTASAERYAGLVPPVMNYLQVVINGLIETARQLVPEAAEEPEPKAAGMPAESEPETEETAPARA